MSELKRKTGVNKARLDELIQITEKLIIELPKTDDYLALIVSKIEKLDFSVEEKIIMGMISGFGAKSIKKG